MHSNHSSCQSRDSKKWHVISRGLALPFTPAARAMASLSVPRCSPASRNETSRHEQRQTAKGGCGVMEEMAQTASVQTFKFDLDRYLER